MEETTRTGKDAELELVEPPGGWDDWEVWNPDPDSARWWNRADRKLLLITFAGTLAANIATVMVVALAISAARQPGTGKLQRPTMTSVVASLVFTAVFVGIAAAVVYFHRKHPADRVLRIFTWVIVACTAFTVTIPILVLLGEAAGIK